MFAILKTQTVINKTVLCTIIAMEDGDYNQFSIGKSFTLTNEEQFIDSILYGMTNLKAK